MRSCNDRSWPNSATGTARLAQLALTILLSTYPLSELLKFREMSLKEASSVSGMSIGALKVATHRATRALRLALRPKGMEE